MHRVTLPGLHALEYPLVLCATSRLAQALKTGYDALQQQRLSRWDALNALTVGQWLDQLGEESLLLGENTLSPMTPLQEHWLWEQVIRESLASSELNALFNISSLANTASEAHAIATGWDFPSESATGSTETRHFTAWRKRFMEQCRKQGLVDRATRYKQGVQDLLTRSPLPGRVLFAGFDQYTPLEKQLQDILISRGTQVGEIPLPAHPSRLSVLSFPDRESELLAAAHWARERLSRNPTEKLAIVVPDLGSWRHLVKDTLDDVFVPESLRPGQAELARPFNISLGVPLDEHLLVGTAFQLLDLLCHHTTDSTVFLSLLHNPLWSSWRNEQSSRTVLDLRMRAGHLPPQPALPQWLQLIRRLDPVPTHLARHVENLLAGQQAFRKARAPSAWAGAFMEQLASAGWLGEYTLSSHDFQTRQAFLEEIGRLSLLDPLVRRMEAPTALAQLSRLCRERIFQPETTGHPSLQVMGLLEAGGLDFDALWVVGMTSDTWPPPTRPNPLLPAEWQRRAGTPNASPGVQLAFARKVHERLCQSAMEVVLSWPASESGNPLQRSPLLAGHDPEPIPSTLVLPHWTDLALHAPATRLECLKDAWAPPVPAGTPVKGGTGLLRAQAVCPAWAYYQYRLHASQLKEPVAVPDSTDRGKLVHRILELLWRELRTSEALQHQTEEQLNALMGRIVEDALDTFSEYARRPPLPNRLRSLERSRLLALLSQWLELELKRPESFEVLDCERRKTFVLERLELQLQVDRIDRLSSGKLVIMDYKTGRSPHYSQWARERLQEPQLPLYAISASPEEGPVSVLALAQVRLDECRFTGLGCLKDSIDGITTLGEGKTLRDFPASTFPDWNALLDFWQAGLSRLAREFGSGVAGIRFEDEKDLEYCEVLPLLRLAERRQQMADPHD